MPQASLGIRMERVERQVSDLVELRGAVASLGEQVSQLRDEMRVAISALSAKVEAGDEETRRSVFEEIRAGDEGTRRVLRAEHEETTRLLREEIRAGNEDSRRYMRVLYEDLVERIKTLGEGGLLPPQSRRE